MNQQQIESLLRILLAAGGPVAGLLVNWGVPSGQVNNYLTLALMILPPLISAGWGHFRTTPSSLAVAADSVPGVSVTVNPLSASQAVVNTAELQTNNIKVSP